MPLRRGILPRHDAGAQALAATRAQAAVKIERVAHTGSTNTDLLERVRTWPASEAFVPVLRVAELQGAGRGRHGRAWHAEAGASLTCSLAWPLQGSDPAGLSLAVGVAVAEALEGEAKAPRIGLKWPNDLVVIDIDGTWRKLGGILIETAPLGAKRVAVIGVGVNVRPLAGAAAPTGTACWREIDAGATVGRALQAIAAPLVQALQTFDSQGFTAFAARFAARDVLRGQRVSSAAGRVPAVAPSGRAPAPPEGRAAGVSARGELIVRGPGGERLVSSGEVSLVRVQAEAGAAC